jgi:hypothetical protein
MESTHTNSAPNLAPLESAIPVQNQASTFYLHGTGPADNPPTLFLDAIAPTATTAKFKDSTSINNAGGNPWKEVGTWPAAAAMTTGSLTSLSDVHVWLGLKNSDDQGTNFDLRVEAYKNSTLVASGQTLCITGVTRNAGSAKEVVLGFDPFSATTFNGTSDVLKLKILTRVGTTPAGAPCGGHSNAVGLRLYFDAVARSSRFIGNLATASDTTPPVISVAQPEQNFITSATQISVTGTYSDQSPTTITVNGVTATLQGNNFTALAPLVEGQNSLVVVATDTSGNTTEITRQVIRDTIAPAIANLQPGEGVTTKNTQVTVTGTFSDATATTIKVNNVPATISGNSFSAVVGLTEGANTIQVVALDAAENRTEVNRTIVEDTNAPAISIERPTDGAVTNLTQFEVLGVITDATVTTVTVNNVSATLTDNSFSAVVAISEGPNVLTVRATDAAGNQTEVTSTVTRDTVAPTLTINAPVDAFVTNKNIVTVSGSTVDATLVTVTANDTALTPGANGAFSDSLPLPAGNTEIQFIATDAAGNQSQTIVRSITVDNTRPVISQLDPSQNSLVDGPTTAVHGHILDATTTIVKVNNVVATVQPNGDFTSLNVPVVQGDNRITISAVDAAGNNAEALLLFTGKDSTPPATPVLFPISSPTRLAFQTIEGRAEPDSQVNITGGIEPIVTTATKGNGLFIANLKLAPGSNTLAVTATDAAGNASQAAQFSILSDPNLSLPPVGQAAQINTSSGNTQRGLVTTELPRPLIAVVTDRAGNPVSGVAVIFSLIQGGGHFVDGIVQATTDAQGHASVRYVSGSTPGIQIVRANFSGNTSTPAVFSADVLEPNNGGTSVSGIVLDQNLRALPNVLVRIGGQQTRTGTDGRFNVPNVAAGPHQLLELIGRDQITLPGRWPNITYDFDVLAGIDNNLGRPLFLPKVNDGISLPLDSNNTVTQDTVFTLPIVGGAPPIRVTARAGTHITFPPDVTDKRLSVTRIPNNRVPMVLEDGRATNLYISVQPSGAIFDQPLMISFPNVDQQPPNAPVLLMSFDHDAGRYVQVGTGHVSADGLTVSSDVGSGIRVGAWHGLPPPPAQQEVTVLGHVQLKDNPAFSKKVVDRAEAWVEGTRAVLVSPPDADERLDFRASYSVPPGSGPRLAVMESTVTAIDTDARIEVKVFNPDGTPSENAALRPSPDRLPAVGTSPSGFSHHFSANANKESGARHANSPQEERKLAYGGSTDALSDRFQLVLKVRDGAIVKNVAWSVVGPGAEHYQLPSSGTQTTLDVIAQLPAGIQTFKAVVTFRRGPREVITKDVEVGVRTDDLIALGYIDRDFVPISDTGISQRIYTNMPVNGSPESLLDRFRCNQAIGHLTINDLDFFRGQGFIFPGLDATERIYILNWMFKYAASRSPTALTGTDFRGDDGQVSEEKVSNFIANHTTSYKVLNRLQLEYRVSEDGFAFNGAPKIRHSASAYGPRTVGLTKNPCGAVFGFGEIFDTQQGYADMKTFSQTENFGQISDGSPDAAAIRAFNTLTGKDVPEGMTAKFWENVGSQIAFPVAFGQGGKWILQPYPTFFIYRNGELVDVIKQAAAPIDHFYPNPYPFGNVPCGMLELITPGGRCGDAQSPPAPGSRVPPYVEELLHPIP